MGVVKKIDIKNRTYYFYKDIDLKICDAGLLKTDKKSYKLIGIYNIGYITKKKIDDCKNIYSANPLYLLISNANRYIERSSAEEKGVIKYLVFDSTDQNKELLKKYNNFWWN